MRSTTVTLEEAQAHLAELVARLVPGEEVIITRDEQPACQADWTARRSASAPSAGKREGETPYPG